MFEGCCQLAYVKKTVAKSQFRTPFLYRKLPRSNDFHTDNGKQNAGQKRLVRKSNIHKVVTIFILLKGMLALYTQNDNARFIPSKRTY